MHQALSDADHEQRLGLFVIIAGQAAQHLRKTRIVGAGSHETHAEDGIPGDREVRVVRVLGEGVEDGELGVGGGYEAERERDGSADRGVAVCHLYI